MAPARSTLFKGIVGVLKPFAGRIERDGLDRREIAYLPQVAEIDRSFPINVYDMVAMGLWHSKGVFAGIGSADRATIADRHRRSRSHGLRAALASGIGSPGGQMHRMLFGRLIVQDARMIVLDEPFNAIDAKTCADMLHLVRHWHVEGRTVLAALHDIDLVKLNFPGTLLLAREPVAWGPTHKVLTPENLNAARRLLRGVRRNRRNLFGCGRSDVGRKYALRRLPGPLRRIRIHATRAGRHLRARFWRWQPIGVFLMLRRMSLIGDALAHAILPGAAIGFLLAGLSLFAMAGGGLIAGFLIAIGAGLIARATPLKEDASLAAFFLISLALGVTIVSVKGSNVDLMNFLFGSVLAIDNPTLILIAAISSVSLVILALIWRPLVCCGMRVDPGSACAR